MGSGVEEYKAYLKSSSSVWNKYAQERIGTITISNIELTNLRTVGLKDGKYPVQSKIFVKVEFKNVSFFGIHISRKFFKSCSFQTCTFDNCKIEAYNFKDGYFKDCDFNNETSFTNCLFSTGFLSRSENMRFESCSLNIVTFSQGILKGFKFCDNGLTQCSFDVIKFENCEFFRNNMHICKFDHVVFDKRCSLVGQSFNKVDISTFHLPPLLWPQIQLTGAIFDPDIADMKQIHASSLEHGVNGIYNRKMQTAALTTYNPAPDSMQGDNPTAIVESLKRARYFLNVSLTMFAIVYLLANSSNDVDFAFQGVAVPIEIAQRICILISIGAITMTSIFSRDAFQGVKYLKTQEGAMTVGNFPWVISRYSKRNIGLHYFLNFLIRLVISYHSLAIWYIAYLNWTIFTFSDIILIGLFVWVLLSSTRLFIISEKFQRPILFDHRLLNSKQGGLPDASGQ